MSSFTARSYGVRISRHNCISMKPLPFCFRSICRRMFMRTSLPGICQIIRHPYDVIHFIVAHLRVRCNEFRKWNGVKGRPFRNTLSSDFMCLPQKYSPIARRKSTHCEGILKYFIESDHEMVPDAYGRLTFCPFTTRYGIRRTYTYSFFTSPVNRYEVEAADKVFTR